MFRRDTPPTPPRAPPPALPRGATTPRAPATPTGNRTAAPSPRTPEGTILNDRPDTPRYPNWSFIPMTASPPPFRSFATFDGGEPGDSSPPSPINWGSMGMEWDDEGRTTNTASSAAAAAAANNDDDEYSDGDDDDYSDDDLLSPHATLTTRLAALIALPSPPTYAELDRRMSQIRALSATLTFLDAPTTTTTTTTTTGIIPSSSTTATTDTRTNTNTNTTPLDNLILSEYRAHLAREAATSANSTAAARAAAVQRALADISAAVRGALQQAGLADNEALFNNVITAARATIVDMLPGGGAWAADVVRWAPAAALVEPAVSRQFPWSMERGDGWEMERIRERAERRFQFGGRVPAARTAVVGRGGGGMGGEVLRNAGVPRNAGATRNVGAPRSAGVSGRVWPDARTMTAEQVAEYNRVAIRQDREEEERWQRQREDERRREVEAERFREEEKRMEMEEEERLREVREIVARRLIAAVEEGMRGG